LTDTAYPRTAIFAMSLFVMVAFGVTLYAMSVLLTEDAAGGEFSISLLSAAFGGSAVIAGLLAPRIGAHADDHSIRGLTLLGGALGAAAMFVFSVAQSGWVVLGAFWFLLGPAAGMALYEPAYVAVGHWVSANNRNKAIALLSLVAGLAGPLFVPATGFLLDGFGWRTTAAVLGAVFLVTAIGASVVYPRHKPGEHRDYSLDRVRWSRFFNDHRLLYLTLAIVLTFAAMNSLIFHRVAVFDEQGFDVAAIAILAGVSGLLTFPGRYLMPRAAEHMKATTLFTIACGGIVAALVVAIMGTTMIAMAGFFFLFGIFFGILLPTRAVIMNGWYAGEDYGAIMGKQWGVAAVVGGITPWLVGAMRDSLGSYTVPLIVLTGLVAVAAAFNIAAAHQRS
jgi:DHA1 family inner membrane transport protein